MPRYFGLIFASKKIDSITDYRMYWVGETSFQIDDFHYLNKS